MKKPEAEENLEKAEFNFMIDLKSQFPKTIVDPKLLQLQICLQNNQKEQNTEDCSPVFSELTERLVLIFAGDNVNIFEKLKK